MTPVLFDLPLRPAEAGAVADLILGHAEGKPLTEDLRNRLAGRAATLKFESLTPWFGSLERDPVHPSVYYLALDGDRGQPLLLRVALASAPSSGLFPKAVLIGRMRTSANLEIVINAIPFAATDRDSVARFAEQVNRAFLPRPQGLQAAIAAAGLPASFDGFRSVFRRHGLNLASLAGDYHTILWAAIRTGWREGYTAEAETLVVPVAASLDAARAAIRQSAAYTKFAVDVSCLIRPEAATGDLKFGECLARGEQLYDAIRQAKASSSTGRAFDFELCLGRMGPPTTPPELAFCLNRLKLRGRPAQLVEPNLGDGAGLKELAAVANQYRVLLSVRSGTHSAKALEDIGRATAGQVNYRASLEAGEPVASVAEHLIG